jgi:Major Facilitator Superfamily
VPPDPSPPRRIPIWQLILLGLVRTGQGLVFPLGRMWRSGEPLDTYGLCHMASVAGDTLLAVALADSIFFSLPVGQAKTRVAAYLLLTMLPLALAGPFLVPMLDRAGPRRAISFGAAAGRAAVAIYAAPRFGTLVLFPSALILLVLSKVHAITKNGLTMAYAPQGEGLMRANARLGRIAVAGALVAAPLGYLFLKIWGSAGTLYLAAFAYAVSAGINLRLPHPGSKAATKQQEVGPRGRVRELTVPSIGAVGMRAASGFLLFLLAFSLRDGGAPTYWFAVLAFGGVAGSFVADLVAPRMPTGTREEGVVIASVSAACVGGLLAFEFYGLPLLTVFALMVGAAAEFGRLAFQSLMQRFAPEGAMGRVFVRYEVLFQLAWVAGAFIPALLPIDFHTGILILTLFYGVLAGVSLYRRGQLRRWDA